MKVIKIKVVSLFDFVKESINNLFVVVVFSLVRFTLVLSEGFGEEVQGKVKFYQSENVQGYLETFTCEFTEDVICVVLFASPFTFPCPAKPSKHQRCIDWHIV